MKKKAKAFVLCPICKKIVPVTDVKFIAIGKIEEVLVPKVVTSDNVVFETVEFEKITDEALYIIHNDHRFEIPDDETFEDYLIIIHSDRTITVGPAIANNPDLLKIVRESKLTYE